MEHIVIFCLHQTQHVAGPLGVSGDTVISGKTWIGNIDAAGGSYSADKILVAQADGEVEYLTTAELKADISDADLWSANTDGSISPSGLTTSIGPRYIYTQQTSYSSW